MVDSGGVTDVPRLAPPVPAPGDKEQKKKKISLIIKLHRA